jgi:dihydrofolate reductase
MGVSLDHYIASPDGGLAWLTKYEKADFGEHGYTTFIKAIRTVVMGRGTYDWLVRAGIDWPHADHRVFVVTSQPIEKPAGRLSTWSEGIDGLVAHLRGLKDGDVLVVGGGRLQQAMIKQGGLDRLELFVVPEIVGEGIPLFPPNGFARTVRLRSAAQLGAGVVRLDYDFRAVA